MDFPCSPSVGTITVNDPFTGAPRPYTMPAGGRGYTRPPSGDQPLVDGAFLLNKPVGPFEQIRRWTPGSGLQRLDRARLLWPEKRDRDPVLGNRFWPDLADRCAPVGLRYRPAFYRTSARIGRRHTRSAAAIG